jgi:hypothetical protein
VTRGDNGEVVSRKFSAQDAKKAGLLNKAGPWTQYPDRMLQMRARGFCARDAVPDVLRGMYVREEMEDARDITPVVKNILPADLVPPPAPTTEKTSVVAPPVEPVSNTDEFIAELEEALIVCQTEDQFDQAWADHLEAISQLGRKEREAVDALYERHQARIIGQASLLVEVRNAQS